MSQSTSVSRALAAMQMAKGQATQKPTEKPADAPTTSASPSVAVADALKTSSTTTTQTTGSQSSTAKTTSQTTKPSDDKSTQKSAYLNGTLANKGVQPSPMTKTSAPSGFTNVDISIAGTPHRISCPIDEVETLNRSAARLNDSLRDIRRGISTKSPTNEELLVLHCLELYDQINELKISKENAAIERERAEVLIDKLIKTAKAIV